MNRDNNQKPMKLTKKLEKELMQVYDSYWDSYLNGDVPAISTLLDESYTQVGSAETEVFTNKKDAVQFLHDTIDQVTGKLEMRNRSTRLEKQNNFLLFHELCDIYALAEPEWIFYSKFRATTIMEEKKDGWKIIHQHSSFPDARTGEGENIAIDKIAEENQQLREAIKRRTVELEHKNGELEIEASLERVRAVAMSMNKSEDLLSICEISFKEFKKLGFNNLRNSLINIFNDEKESFVNYDYSHYMGGSISNVSYNSNPANDEFLINIRKANDVFVETVIDRNQLDEWKEFRRSHGEQDDSRLDNINALYYYNYSIGSGSIGISNFNPISEEQQIILKRFRNVFNLSYQRYLDIAIAATQAREAQIEAALERVRSRTMGMQKSEELKEVIQVVYEQFVHLNIHIEHTGFIMDYKARDDMHIWLADKHEVPTEVTIPYFDCAHWNSFNEAKEKGIDFFANHLTFEEKNKFYQELFKLIPGVPEETLEYYFGCPGLAISTVLLDDVGLYIENFSGIPYSDEENNTLMRFGKVFQQTYTRFNDLKQAEAQVREAQIEAALEKVRSRTMAMQKSDELAETAYVLYEQFGLLGENPEQLTIGIIDETHKMWEFWLTLGGNQINHVFKASIDEPIVLNKSYIAWKERKKSIVIDISGDELKAYYNFFKNLPDYKEFNDFKNNQKPEQRRVINIAFFSNGSLSLSSHEPKPAETIQLLERFAGVLEQTYTRFLDLQKAEAQAREAQIEGALERVRSKTMAMHNSQDVGVTVVTLFDEVLKLGLDKFIRVGIGILEGNEGMETWSATSTPEGKVDLKMGMLDMTIHPMLIGLKKAWESGKTGYSYNYMGDDVFRYYKALNNEPDYPFQADLDSLPENEYHKSFFYKEGILFSFAPNPISDEAAKVLDRFAGVFGQTYRRYLDLQKAEAQAREAKIEASLERVRSKAMSMHSSEDLALTIDHFFHELKSLNVKPIRCGVGIKDGDSRTVDVTVTSATEKGEDIKLTGKLTLGGHPILDKVYEALQLQAEYFPVLRGEEISEYYQAMNPDIEFPNFTEDDVQYGYYFHYEEGGVFAWTEKELLEEEINIFRKFKSVLSLTYRRYIDLKEAEARSVEAVRQASLDRVRAEIASMRTSEDLNHITPIIWRELKNLEVPFFRCGVFIVDKKNEKVQVYLTKPDGKSLGVLNLPFDSNELTSNTVDNWRKKAVYKEHWNKEEFISWTHSMMEIGQVQNEETYQGSANPPESLDLHFVPFAQGMLYVGNTSPLSEEKIASVKSLAEAFSIAYGRYEDFDRLETAKKEVESAFGELDLLSKELKIKNEELETENQRKALELEEARQLQLSMLPKELPKLPNLDIAVYMKTATEVGGDYYDFKVDTSGTLTVAVGDATGHGMKAGTIVSMIKALFASGGSRMDMKSFFNQSSDALKRIELGRLTMGFVMLKIKTNKLKFANAGMPPLFIYRKRLAKVEEIMIHAMPLGAIKDFPYEISELEISSGDTILLLSDGLPELKNERNQQYGYAQVKEKFKFTAEKSPDEIVEYLKNTASKWINGVEPDDDITFVVIKVK